ncbi:hypothetical protein DINM_001372 [Dirofilaria immitis]|nr:hypothetical protein [Dirofilaria immitis]
MRNLILGQQQQQQQQRKGNTKSTKEMKEMKEMMAKVTDKTPTKGFVIKTDDEAICDDEICNNRGTCLGTKDTNFCICKLGYTGLHCETSSSMRFNEDCNGKGLCIGTSSNFTCMCQFGYGGDHCEHGPDDPADPDDGRK